MGLGRLGCLVGAGIEDVDGGETDGGVSRGARVRVCVRARVRPLGFG